MLLEAQVDTRTHTPTRPSQAERARTVLAAAASVSVRWDGGRVDLLGCHHDDPLGDVILTLETSSTLARAAQAARGTSEEDIPVTVELTELCAVSVRDRVRSRVCLGGWMSLVHPVRPGRAASTGSVSLRVDVAEVMLEEDGRNEWVTVEDYRRGEPDPLHLGAAEQLQHLVAHHPDAIVTLSRLCEPEELLGVVRILPIALDRYGIVLRVEKLRDHTDVRLPFRRRVDSGTEAAAELRHLLAEGSRRRPCAR
ncbi:DUF2470 domain-containing protein [Kineosporia succinea]